MKKKIISLLLCGALIGSSLGLVACDNDVPDKPDKPPVVTPDDPDNPDRPDKPDNPDNPDKPPVNPDDPNPPQPGDEHATLLDRAKTLAQGVEDLPDMSGVENIGGATMSARRNGGARADADREVVDVTTPSRDSVSDYDAHYGQQITFVDNTIAMFKATKDDALEVCRQLGVWVAAPEYFCDFKVAYDKENDAVTIEQRYDSGNQTVYSKIRCAYNYLGKMTVGGTYAIYYNDNGTVMSFSVDYVEDESWTCAYNEPYYEMGIEYRYLLQADLSSEERAVTKQYMQDGDDGLKMRKKTIITEYEGKPIVIEYDLEEAKFSTARFDVYDTSGGVLLKNIQYNGGEHSLELNLYSIDGWDRAFYYLDESTEGNHRLRLQIGDDEYDGSQKQYFDDTNKSGWYLRGSIYTGGQAIKPLIWCSLYDGVEIDEFLAKWGLTLKPELAETVDYLCYGGWDFDALLSGWTAFGVPEYMYLSDDAVDELYDDIAVRLGHFDKDKWNAEYDGIFTPEAIAQDEQTENNEIYENINIRVSGTVNAVDIETLDISGVRCEIPASVLFEENGNYALTVALLSDSELIGLETQTVEYSREGVTIDGFAADAAVPALEQNKKYVLVAYLAKRVEDKEIRISDYRYLDGGAARELTTVGTRYVSQDLGEEVKLTEVVSGRTVACGAAITVTDVYSEKTLPAIAPEQTGSPVYDVDALTFDFASVAFEYAQTPFLNVGDEYKIVLSLDGAGESIELAAITGSVGETALECAFDKITLKTLGVSVDKEYTLKMSLYKANGNRYDCLSRYAVVAAESAELNFSGTNRFEEAGELYDATFAGVVKYGADGITVTYETADYVKVEAAE